MTDPWLLVQGIFEFLSVLVAPVLLSFAFISWRASKIGQRLGTQPAFRSLILSCVILALAELAGVFYYISAMPFAGAAAAVLSVIAMGYLIRTVFLEVRGPKALRQK